MTLWLVLSPFAGTVTVVLLRSASAKVLRAATLTSLLCTAAIATALVFGLVRAARDGQHPGGVIQWTLCNIPRQWPADRPFTVEPQSAPWLSVVLSFGCDGVNVAALLWTAWLAVAATAWTRCNLERSTLYFGLWSAWTGCLLGSFAAYDALTFLTCDALALWLGYALIGEWGHGQRRAAAGRFWRHQFAGHAAWCAGLVGLGVVAAWCRYSVLPALPTLNWTWHTLTEVLPRVVGSSWGAAQYWQAASPVLLLLLGAGAVLRSPLMPFHSWWVSASVEAPAPVGALLAAVWAPQGLYAWVRFVAPVLGSSFVGAANLLAVVTALTAIAAGLLAFSQIEPRRYASYGLVCLNGIAWMCLCTGTAAGYGTAFRLSQAAGVGCAAWLLLTSRLEPHHSTHADSIVTPSAATLSAVLLAVLCGFPAVGRGRIDLLTAWLLFEAWPLGLLIALAGWLLVGWGGVWTVQRWLYPEPSSGLILDVSPRGIPSRDLTRMELLALTPLLAWCLCNWCVPWPSDTTTREWNLGQPPSTVLVAPKHWELRKP